MYGKGSRFESFSTIIQIGIMRLLPARQILTLFHLRRKQYRWKYMKEQKQRFYSGNGEKDPKQIEDTGKE